MRSNHSSVVVGSEIYVIDGDSGIGGRNKRDDIWKSADGGQSWTEVPATGAEFLDYDSQNLAVLDSEIYVIGVVDGTSYLDDIWKSADGGQTWTEVPVTGAKFSARSGHSLVVVGSEIYLIGGFDGTNYLNDVWKSADRGLTWKNVHAAP